MMRSRYDLRHFSFVPLLCGRLQTLFQFQVFAGDSLDLRSFQVCRLSPLRRYMVVEPALELFAFYIPSRHIYGDLWIDFISQGIDESVTLPSYPFPNSTGNAGYLGFRSREGHSYPAESIDGYNQIWNRYFRVPSDNSSSIGFGELPNGFLTIGGKAWEYGHRCAYPKTIYNTGLVSNLQDADYQVPSEGVLDVRELEQVRARYGSEQARNFFANTDRYRDFLKLIYGKGSGKINIDADQRPELLMHHHAHVGGGDVNGTGDTNLGNYTGKGIGGEHFGFPRRFFPESGRIWLMALFWCVKPALKPSK